MKLPVLCGNIKRRLLINFRVDAAVMQGILPAPFRPKLHDGYAIAGICLIRLENIRPQGFPSQLGFSSENAAHRIAVEWTDSSGKDCQGVYIPRRDTGSQLNHLGGGRLFPGEHHFAEFTVEDDGSRVNFTMESRDKSVTVRVRGFDSDAWATTSCFASLADSSSFFEHGSIGYSVTRDAHRLDGLRLVTDQWRVRAFAIELVASTYFADVTQFPAGSAEFDHALIMRDIPHEWRQTEAMNEGPTCDHVHAMPIR